MQNVTAFPWLTVIILLPLAGGVLLGLVSGLARYAKIFAFGLSVFVFVLYIGVLWAYFSPAHASQVQLAEHYRWIYALGVSFAWGINGMGAVMTALAVFLVPTVIAASWNSFDIARERGYFAWILVLEAIIIALFAARDVFVFYILFEAMVVPMYFLIGRYGMPGAKRAAMKFLLYSLFGGLIMLLGVIALYVFGPGGKDAYLLDTLSAGAVPGGSAQMWIFFAFFIAFAIKAPMWPLHTWLPDTAEKAPAGTSVLLVGVLDKLGTYGMLSICVPLFPQAVRAAAVPVTVLAVISVLWGALMAIGSDDLLRLVAYTSVSHFGFMIMAIFSGSPMAVSGAILYMVAHGVCTAGMFLIVDFLRLRGKTTLISRYGGWQRVTPVLAGCFFTVGLAAIALPGLSGFVPEYLVLVGTFRVFPWAAVAAVIGVVLAALYMLLPYQRVFTGPRPQIMVHDLNKREKTVMGILIAAMLCLGFFPAAVLDCVNPVAEETAQLTESGQTGAVPAAEGSAPAQAVADEGSGK